MTAKEYLSRAKRLNDRIEAVLFESASLRAWPLTGDKTDPRIGRVQGGFVGDKAASVAETIMALEARADKLIDKLIEIKAEISERLGQLPENNLQYVLACRYLDFLDWRETGARLNLTWQHARRLHAVGLKLFEKIFKDFLENA